MLDQGYISQDAYDEAMADDVYSRIQNVNTNITQSTTPQSYFVDALTEQILNDLEDPDIGLGYSETQAYNTLYKGGLSIYSTQDLESRESVIRLSMMTAIILPILNMASPTP